MFTRPDTTATTYLLLVLAAILGLGGCSLSSSPILFPAGPITATERDLLFIATLVMLTVLAPVYLLTFLCCWRYREGGPGSYRPDWHKSWKVELFVWSGPLVIIVIISYLVVVYTYRLDPYKPLQHTPQGTHVQAVAQDWKWLFIYPEQGIATVNELAFPQSRPLNLEITSDTVMTSFMIPALGGQIYAMAGMTTQLNLEAHKTGAFTGRNTQFSGTGFPDMAFTAKSLPDDEFQKWVATVHSTGNPLHYTRYQTLTSPGSHPVEFFSWVEPTLFQCILHKYTGQREPSCLAN